MTVAPTPLNDREARQGHRLAMLLGGIALIVLVIVAVALLIQQGIIGNASSSSKTVEGSGVAGTQTRTVSRFSGVDLAGSNIVNVNVGGKQSVVVHADENLLSRVTTRVQSGTLVIGNTPGSFSTTGPMRVEVSVPSLEALMLDGSGIVSVTGIESSRLAVTLTGSGTLRASGAAETLMVTLSGSGGAYLGSLAAHAVYAVVSGSGRVVVTATKSLDASIPGSGEILYGGSPADVTKSVTGSGEIIAI